MRRGAWWRKMSRGNLWSRRGLPNDTGPDYRQQVRYKPDLPRVLSTTYPGPHELAVHSSQHPIQTKPLSMNNASQPRAKRCEQPVRDTVMMIIEYTLTDLSGVECCTYRPATIVGHSALVNEASACRKTMHSPCLRVSNFMGARRSR